MEAAGLRERGYSTMKWSTCPQSPQCAKARACVGEPVTVSSLLRQSRVLSGSTPVPWHLPGVCQTSAITGLPQPCTAPLLDVRQTRHFTSVCVLRWCPGLPTAPRGECEDGGTSCLVMEGVGMVCKKHVLGEQWMQAMSTIPSAFLPPRACPT